MSFQVIAGSGHCGTMWLARVLDSVPGARWYHELRTEITRMPWHIADEFHPEDALYDDYWDQLERELWKHNTVGDSNSWPPESLTVVNRRMAIQRVIYLTRDKEAQLHSILNHSPIWSLPEERWPEAAKVRLMNYCGIAKGHVLKWYDLSYEERVRLLVEANDFMPPWLREQGLTVDVYSLEELTTDVDTLRELAPLEDAELVSWQQTDINRKVPA